MLTDQAVRPPQRVRPGEEARKLYRELVRKAHPDLAQEDEAGPARGVHHPGQRRLRPWRRQAQRCELAEVGRRSGARAAPEPGRELYVRLEWSTGARRCSRCSPRSWRRARSGPCSGCAPDDPDRLLEEIAEQLATQVRERRPNWRRCSGGTEPGGGSGSVWGMSFGAGVPTVEVTDLKDGDFLLDVREDDEWQAGHAAGALHIPISEFVARHGELTEVRAAGRPGPRDLPLRWTLARSPCIWPSRASTP